MAHPRSDVWQTLLPAGSALPGPVADTDGGEREAAYLAPMPDGRLLTMPIRALPGRAGTGVASLIINQASFQVLVAFADAMAVSAAAAGAEVIVGVPTLGLALAPEVARRLGHSRYVPLGTSAKFWYDAALSEPLSSITTPGGSKSLYIDPRMLPLLEGRRVVVVDDAVSTGRSMSAVLRLMAKIGCAPVAIVVAMMQTERWREALAAVDPAWPEKVHGVIRTPLLARAMDGRWRADD